MRCSSMVFYDTYSNESVLLANYTFSDGLQVTVGPPRAWLKQAVRHEQKSLCPWL